MILLNKERIARTLKRISMQIAEETKGSHIHLIGMNKRGLILATILQEHLSEILDTTPELFNLIDGLPEESDPIPAPEDRKSTRLNSSHVAISYAVFCLKKKTNKHLKRHFYIK